MKTSTVLLCLLATFICCTGASASSIDRTAEQLNDHYKGFFPCVTEHMQSMNISIPVNPFRTVTDESGLAPMKTSVYFTIDVTVADLSPEGMRQSIRKNLYRIVERMNDSFCDILSRDECQGLMIRYKLPGSLASNTTMIDDNSLATLCVSKYDARRVIAGALSIDDLFCEKFSKFMHSGKLSAIMLGE